MTSLRDLGQSDSSSQKDVKEKTTKTSLSSNTKDMQNLVHEDEQGPPDCSQMSHLKMFPNNRKCLEGGFYYHGSIFDKNYNI